MYEVELSGKKLYVTFLYEIGKLGKSKEPQEITTCVIRMYDPFITAFGSTVCNPNDDSNQWAGRKVAYKRAIKHIYSESRWYVFRDYLDGFPASWNRFWRDARCALYDARTKLERWKESDK